MRFVMRSVAGWSIASSFAPTLIIVGGLLASFSLSAAPPVENTPCILDQPANTLNGLNCTANDTTLSSPTITVVEPCNFPGDTALLQVLADITVGAQTRYDLAVWLAVDGDPNADGAATGTCSVVTVANDLLHVDGLTTTFGDSDQCGDVFNVAPEPPVPPEETAHLLDADLGTVSLLCNDSDGDGQIDVPIVIAWEQQASNNCAVSSDALPGTASKCVQDNSFSLAIPIPGRIIVDKVTVPSDDTVFNFLFEGPASPNEGGFDGSEVFSLSDASPAFDTGTAFVGGVLAGIYSVSEEVAPGYILTDITCTGSEGAEDPAAIDLAPGETVNCVFTNTLNTATINVVKNTVGGNGGFLVDWTGPTTSGNVVLDTGVINTDTETIVTTETGIFELQELVPAGWILSNAICTNDVGGATVGVWDNVDTISGVDLSPGDSVTCTFTNQAVGTVTLVKNTVGGDGSFDFVTDVPGLGSNIQTAGGTGQTSASNVPAGTYSIAETVPAGWQLDSATCSDGSPPDALILTQGETVTCTFTNIKDGEIIVDKVTLPAASPQSFLFALSGEGVDQAFALTDADTPHLSGFLTPGTFSVTESPVAGWVLTDVTCTGQPGGDDEDPAAIDLEPGEVVTCVFTNTQNGSIEVVKSLSDTGPADETFSFTSSFNGVFNLVGDAATTGPVEVTPGSGYTVSEDDPSATGWVNTGASCGDGSDPLTDIVVSPGEAVVCTFTNTPLGSAVVIKDTVGGNGIFGFTGDAPIGPFSLDTTDQFTATTGDLFDYILTAGVYDVTEDNIPPGWVLTSIGCDDDSATDLDTATASMDVQLAETVTCTFTNTADGTLIIRKETLPEDAELGFDFTGDAAGTIRDFSATADEIVVSGQPGTYTSTESVPAGWAITDISCQGQLQSGITIGADNVSVDLAAGETVICTFENSAQSSITIEKFTQGGLGAFQFNSDLGPFQLDTLTNGNPDSVSFTGLASGTYMFSEVIPSNWTLSGIQCSGASENTFITIGGEGDFDPGDQGVTIDLADGDAIVCTFVNDADGSITVTKVTDPSGSAQIFDFSGAITASLTDGQTSTAILVPPGNYAVTEAAVAGWDVTNITCSDDDSTGTGSTANFVVAPGEVVNCTFTNTIQRGNIVVEKQTDPDGSSQLFDFTTSYSGGFSISDGQQNDSGPLLPTSEAGTYSVSESLPAGWELTSATCSDGSSADAIDLAPGETVTCVFTNTIQRGNIIVQKVTDPDTSNEDFGFVTNYGDPFVLMNGEQNDSGALLPTSEAGTYSVIEDDELGWELTSAICDDGSDPTAIDLAPGETVTCVFTNTIQRGNIIVQKVTDPDTSTEDFGFVTNYGDPFVLMNGEQNDSGALLPTSEAGTYSVIEDDELGWELTSAICDDGSDPTAIDLAPGETVTCVFTNTLQGGNIIVQKVTDPDTSTEDFGFVTNYGDPFVLMNGEQNDSGALLPTSEAGTYSVIEDDKLGWVLTSAICDDGSDPTAIDLAPGETVTCVFTNTSSASVTIVKELLNLPDDSYCFEVTSSEIDEGFCIQTQGGTGEERFEDVATGFYSFREVRSGTYAVISNECSNGDNADELVLGPGDDVTCTFVNIPVSPVPGNNPLALLTLILMMLAAGWYFRPAGLRRF